MSGLDRAEVRIQLKSIEAHCADGVVEVRAVEEVVELGTEMELLDIVKDVKRLLDRHIHVDQIRTRKLIPGCVAGARRPYLSIEEYGLRVNRETAGRGARQ